MSSAPQPGFLLYITAPLTYQSGQVRVQSLMKTSTKLSLVTLLLASSLGAYAATYTGNGNSSFGGTIGLGSLTLTDNGTTVSGSLTIANTINNALVIYIDNGLGGGFADTSGFNDQGDQLRQTISGVSGSGRSLMTFASGFAPQYAISLQPDDGINFGGMWQLANGGNNSLPFITSVNLTPTGTGTAPGPYTFSFNLSSIGLAPNSGATFELFGTYISDSGYRSGEALPGNDTGSPGWNPFVQTAFASYTTVPEPSSIGLLLLGAGALVTARRRK
jgi:hypothetical protein